MKQLLTNNPVILYFSLWVFAWNFGFSLIYTKLYLDRKFGSMISFMLLDRIGLRYLPKVYLRYFIYMTVCFFVPIDRDWARKRVRINFNDQFAVKDHASISIIDQILSSVFIFSTLLWTLMAFFLFIFDLLV